MALLKKVGQYLLTFLLGWAVDFFNKHKSKKEAALKAKLIRDQLIKEKLEDYSNAQTAEERDKAHADLIRCIDCK